MHRGVEKKDLPPKGLRKRLSKATSKLFNRKSGHGLTPKDAGHQEDSSSEGSKEKIGGIDNLGANVFALGRFPILMVAIIVVIFITYKHIPTT